MSPERMDEQLKIHIKQLNHKFIERIANTEHTHGPVTPAEIPATLRQNCNECALQEDARNLLKMMDFVEGFTNAGRT